MKSEQVFWSVYSMYYYYSLVIVFWAIIIGTPLFFLIRRLNEWYQTKKERDTITRLFP